MATAREVILGRLRATTPQLPDAAPVPPDTPARASLDECVARFALEAAALGVECFVEPSTADVQQRVSALTADKTVLTWDALPYGLEAHLRGAIPGSAPRSSQAAAEIGVTGCDAAVAETASLVLFSAPGRSRAVSLLPPTHIAIVQTNQMRFTMAEVFTEQAERFRAAASCTIITGPSRTADIELTLTLGIHGPGKVIVIVGP